MSATKLVFSNNSIHLFRFYGVDVLWNSIPISFRIFGFDSCSFLLLFEYIFRLCVRLRGKSFNWFRDVSRMIWKQFYRKKKSSCAESCRHHTKNEVYPRYVVTITVMLVCSIETRITRRDRYVTCRVHSFPDSIAKSISRPTLQSSVYLHIFLPSFFGMATRPSDLPGGARWTYDESPNATAAAGRFFVVIV